MPESLYSTSLYGESYYPVSGNELVFTDEYLYKNIDKILKLHNLTYILINFSDIPLQEDILIRLSEIKTLTKLELSFMFSDIAIIPDSIFSITTLRVLHISNSRTSELPSAIVNLKNLKKLTVIQTQIETLPESILELSELEVLEVEINCLTELPEHMEKLSKLKMLDISHNVDLISDQLAHSLRSKMPQLKLYTIEENSPEHIEIRDGILRHERVEEFYLSLDASKLTPAHYDTILVRCQELIATRFGSEDEESFNEDVRCLTTCFQDCNLIEPLSTENVSSPTINKTESYLSLITNDSDNSE